MVPLVCGTHLIDLDAIGYIRVKFLHKGLYNCLATYLCCVPNFSKT